MNLKLSTDTRSVTFFPKICCSFYPFMHFFKRMVLEAGQYKKNRSNFWNGFSVLFKSSALC